ncbi:MAG: peptidoglycan editing factor PgeF [Georgenia sp.]
MSPAPPVLLPADLGPGARGGFTTRTGGVSTGDHAAKEGLGLNLARHVGDDAAAVTENRARLAAATGAPVVWMDQVHGTVVRVLDAHAGGQGAGECDAVVVIGRGIACGVLVADCVPVLLAAADGSTVAAVHVGRRGLVEGVLQAALAALVEHGVTDVRAAVGPSICGRCYEVPARLRDTVERAVPGTAATTTWGTPALDLPAGVLATLAAAGVRRVDHVAACTLEDERFYSHRRAGREGRASTGRFAGVVLAP